jgi:hypothetical protein
MKITPVAQRAQKGKKGDREGDIQPLSGTAARRKTECPPFLPENPLETSSFTPNDTLVTVTSAMGTLGTPSYAEKAAGGFAYMYSGGTHPNEGRNHSSIADSGVAYKVWQWLWMREKSHGDLRPIDAQ